MPAGPFARERPPARLDGCHRGADVSCADPSHCRLRRSFAAHLAQRDPDLGAAAGPRLGLMRDGAAAKLAALPAQVPAVDRRRQPFVAKRIPAAKAPVLRRWSVGPNSRPLPLASQVGMTLRPSLPVRALANEIGSRQRIALGEFVPDAALAPWCDRRVSAEPLRARTCALHPSPGPARSVLRRRFA